MVCVDPTTVVRVRGAAPAVPSQTTCKPGGELFKVTCTVCGQIVTWAAPVRPLLSVAVSRISKWISSPWSGMVKLPPAPVPDMNGWL